MAAVRIEWGNRSLPERILYGLLAVAVLALGFFFLVAALVAGALLAAVLLVRFWWLKRKLKRAADEEFITTEYTVVESEKVALPPVSDTRTDSRRAE